MDRGAWWGTTHVSQTVRHDLETKEQQQRVKHSDTVKQWKKHSAIMKCHNRTLGL